MNNRKYPNEHELVILQLAYERFYSYFDEFMADDFWELSSEIRLLKIKACFDIYNELLKYEPIKKYTEYLKEHRPPQEGFIAYEYFVFVRNILTHFPFFLEWNDIYITENLSGWNSPQYSSINKFIKQNIDKESVKYRVWIAKSKKMVYMDINFPKKSNDKIFLRDLISEKEGLLFCMVLMKQVIDSQIEKV